MAQHSTKHAVVASNKKEQRRVAKKYPGVKKISEGIRPETQDSYDDPVFDYETSRFHPENVDAKQVLSDLKATQKKQTK